MSPTFVGWDVGAWNSERQSAKSRDALFAFQPGKDGELVPVGMQVGYRPTPGHPFRAELLEAQSPDFLLELLGLEHQTGPRVLAIDAPLGLPVAFMNAVIGQSQDVTVPPEADQNPFTFRIVDRRLAAAGIRPLSAVRDMLGSQSSKALFFLRKFGFQQVEPSIWQAGDWTAIETYPALLRHSEQAHDFVQALFHDHFPAGFAAAWPNVYADKRDAAYCGFLASRFSLNRGALVGPPQQLEGEVTAEGWIWYPQDTGVELPR